MIDTIDIMAFKENTSHYQEKCSHEKAIANISITLECLDKEKNEVLDEIENLEVIIDDYQNFYEEYASSNQTNAVSIMAEEEFNKKWNTLDSLNTRVDEIKMNIQKCQSELDILKKSCTC